MTADDEAQKALDARKDRAVSIPHLSDLPALTDAMRRDLFDLERARELAAAAKAKGNRRMRRQHEDTARVIAARVQAARTEQLNAHWAEKANAETEKLATARGEEVETITTVLTDWVRDERGVLVRRQGQAILQTDTATARRVSSRTGLLLAYERGDLDQPSPPDRVSPGRPAQKAISAERLYELGKKYRDNFEIGEDRRSAPRDEGQPSTPPTKPSVGPAGVKLDAARSLNTMRDGLTRKQRDALDLICGWDLALTAAAQVMGAGVPATRRALRAGLTRAGENLMTW